MRVVSSTVIVSSRPEPVMSEQKEKRPREDTGSSPAVDASPRKKKKLHRPAVVEEKLPKKKRPFFRKRIHSKVKDPAAVVEAVTAPLAIVSSTSQEDPTAVAISSGPIISWGMLRKSHGRFYTAHACDASGQCAREGGALKDSNGVVSHMMCVDCGWITHANCHSAYYSHRRGSSAPCHQRVREAKESLLTKDVYESFSKW